MRAGYFSRFKSVFPSLAHPAAGDGNDSCLRPLFAYPGNAFDTAHSRHKDVDEYRANGLVLGKDRLGILQYGRIIAVIFQNLRQRMPDQRVVIDDKYGFTGDLHRSSPLFLIGVALLSCVVRHIVFPT